MDVTQRIQQFGKMVEADPDNELAHLSLGKALAEAGRFAEALGPMMRVLELNPDYSRAYQDLASVQVQLQRREAAIATLGAGFAVADRRGDLMPRDAMARMLSDLGQTPPAASAKAPAAGDIGAAEFHCSRCGQPAGRMEKVPFKGELGERVRNNVCAGCWREWVEVGTKVINELGLTLSDPQAQETYDEHLVEFLQLDR